MWVHNYVIWWLCIATVWSCASCWVESIKPWTFKLLKLLHIETGPQVPSLRPHLWVPSPWFLGPEFFGPSWFLGSWSLVPGSWVLGPWVPGLWILESFDLWVPGPRSGSSGRKGSQGLWWMQCKLCGMIWFANLLISPSSVSMGHFGGCTWRGIIRIFR